MTMREEPIIISCTPRPRALELRRAAMDCGGAPGAQTTMKEVGSRQKATTQPKQQK